MINADDKTKLFFNELLKNFNEAAAKTSKETGLKEFDKPGTSIIDIKNYFGLNTKPVETNNGKKKGMMVGDIFYGPNCYDLL